MADHVRSRLLPGAPRWLLGLVVLGSVLFWLLATLRLVHGEAVGELGPLVDVPVLVVVHLLLLALLTWRARRVASERAVWTRLALGAGVFVVGIAAACVLGAIPATRSFALAPLYWSGAAVFPFWYGAFVRWNRHSTSISDPNDALNGASAALAVVALLNLTLAEEGSALAELPWWELQAVFTQFAVGFVLLGTALTLPFLGAMGRDPRTWLVAGSQSLWVAGAVAALLTGGHAAGWTPAFHPLVIVCLAVAATLRSRRAAPQPADPGAATIGAFVVIVASLATLLAAALTDGPVAAVLCAAAAGVGAGVRMAINVRELAQLAVTRREALTDELTGLANRRALLRRISELSAEGTPVALALLDVDKFKEVNDALGVLCHEVVVTTRTGLDPGGRSPLG